MFTIFFKYLSTKKLLQKKISQKFHSKNKYSCLCPSLLFLCVFTIHTAPNEKKTDKYKLSKKMASLPTLYKPTISQTCSFITANIV